MKLILQIIKSKIFQLILAAVILSYIIWRFNISVSRIFTRVEEINYIFIAIIIAVFIRPFIASSRWLIFLSYSGIKENIFQLIKISWSSTFYTMFMPLSTAGDMLKMFFIEKKYPEKRGFSGASVIADRMVGLILFALIAGIGSLFLPDNPLLNKIQLVIFSAFVFVLILTFTATNNNIYNFITPLLNRISFLKFVFNYVTKLHKSLVILPYFKILPKVVPLILLFQLINISLAHLVFLAVGIHIPFYYQLVFIPIIQVISLLPVSVAGLGFREGVFIYFYKIVNIPAEISFSVSIIYFLITMGLSALCGGLIILVEKIRLNHSPLVKEKTEKII